MSEYTVTIYPNDGSRIIVRIRCKNIDAATMAVAAIVDNDAEFIIVPGRSNNLRSE